MIWVVTLLIVLAPLPEGSAYPWALTAIESLIFALIAAWLFEVGFSGESPTSFGRARPLFLPAILFAVLVLAQLTPLPSGLIRIISPATYRLYELTLPEWSQIVSCPLVEMHHVQSAGSDGGMHVPVGELARGVNIPLVIPNVMHGRRPLSSHPAAEMRVIKQWRTLSIAPSMSSGALLELTAYGFLFLLVLCYPFGPPGRGSEERLSRTIVSAALLSGLIAALVGLIELFAWNGKVLWIFVPYDWGSPRYAMPLRASGPFINPDHFGNYLALILPLAVGEALFPSDRFYKKPAIRVVCGLVAFFVICAIMSSLSRGAWMGAAIALAILFALSARARGIRSPASDLRHKSMVQRACVLLFLTIALCLIFIGPNERNQVDLRLEQTVARDIEFDGRLELDADTLAMIRDFPLVGVGLGSWPELFPHYRQPPWGPEMYREAHNDYLQLMAETGVLGFVLIAWLFGAIAQRIGHAIVASSLPTSPVLIMLCSSLAAMIFHEFSDFSLRTPANALLFTILSALTLRLAEDVNLQNVTRIVVSGKMRLSVICFALFSIVFVGFALAQEKIPYPHNIQQPQSIQQGCALVSGHPAEATPHLELLLLAGGLSSSSDRLDELHTVVWLDPTNPYTRDLYAWVLIEQGMTVAGLTEMAQSIFDSPMPSTHFYLDDETIAGLSVSEQAAIERGFRLAIERKEYGAVEGLADYYNEQRRYVDAAGVYDRAAMVEHDRVSLENYLVDAGVAYAHASDYKRAEGFFDRAISYEPADERPYRFFTTLVLGPQRELKAAQTLIAHGVREGADVAVLCDALANVATADNDRELTEIALEEWVAERPSYFALYRLGMFYLSEAKYGRAAMFMRGATESDPRSANAYYYLGVAEERDYHFSDAQQDLSKAVQLAPTNTDYRDHYADFEHKVTENTRPRQSANE